MDYDMVRTKCIIAQFANATKYKSDAIKFAMDPDNINIWYFMLYDISGTEEEYVDGEYLFRLYIAEGAGKTWLAKPPRIIALTPNGVYGVNGKFCVGNGEFHRGEKAASEGPGEFAGSIYSGLIGWKELGGGINIINTTIDEKRKLAKLSKEYNKKNYPGILSMISFSYDDYSKKFKDSKTIISNNDLVKEILEKNIYKPSKNIVGNDPYDKENSQKEKNDW
jgi:hypothetical protein